MSRLLILVLVCVSLTACSSDKPDGAADAAGAAPADASRGADAGSGGGFVGEVTIAGGPDAGTYKYLSRIPCIDYAAMGLGIGGMGDTVTSKVLRLGFATTTGTKSGTIEDFDLNFLIERPNSAGEQYKIEPKKGEGTGKATISGAAPEYTINVDGKTAGGIGVRSTIRCTK